MVCYSYKYPVHMRSRTWGLQCLLIRQWLPVLQISRQCSPQIRLPKWACSSAATLSAYGMCGNDVCSKPRVNLYFNITISHNCITFVSSTSVHTGKQVFYLSDEVEAPGKDANIVVSQVHHNLCTFGLGEQHAIFDCGNCTDQNKNHVVIWYALWQVLAGKEMS